MNPCSTQSFKFLLAEDDEDDRLLFENAVKELTVPVELTTLENGERLMKHLLENRSNLPDVLFLDIHMPRKNGVECLAEIKSHPDLKHIHVIIFSGNLNEEIAFQLYRQEEHYYIQKPQLPELKKFLQSTILLLTTKKAKLSKEQMFILN